MRYVFAGTLSALACLSANTCTRAGETKPGMILAEWAKKKNRIHSLRCLTKMEKLYPAGSLSLLQKKKKDKLNPPRDQRFTDQRSEWLIDFKNNRVRKEYVSIGPLVYPDESVELTKEHSIDLFADGKFRQFRDKNLQTPKSKEMAAIFSDVTLHESMSHDFVLDMHDLPLIWVGGGVSGAWPQASNLRHSAGPWKFGGNLVHRGQPCVLLSAPEQKSRTSVREFVVESEAPFRIRQCRARDGATIYWQVDVDYRTQSGESTPSRWTSTQFKDGVFAWSTTYEVEKLDLNVVLSDEHFQKQLEAGMIVFHTEKNQHLAVDARGGLVPLGSAHSQGVIGWIAIGSLVLVALALCWRYGRSFQAKSR